MDFKIWHFLGYYSTITTEECNKETYIFVFVNFGIFMSSTTTDFLKVREHVSSKLTTNGSIRRQGTSKINIFEAIILNQKRRSATKVLRVFKMVLQGLYFLQLYIF